MLLILDNDVDIHNYADNTYVCTGYNYESVKHTY